VRTIYDEARFRGWQRGRAERDEAYEPSDSPLSGEWAGESFSELLGDLVGERCPDEMTEYELISELCDEYERGYFDAFDDEEL
jgi:hypothetical protein